MLSVCFLCRATVEGPAAVAGLINLIPPQHVLGSGGAAGALTKPSSSPNCKVYVVGLAEVFPRRSWVGPSRQKHHERVAFETAQKKARLAQLQRLEALPLHVFSFFFVRLDVTCCSPPDCCADGHLELLKQQAACGSFRCHDQSLIANR